MIRRTALSLSLAAAALAFAGCNARDPAALQAGGFGEGSYTEGGYGSPFYAEVVYAKEGARPRVYLFGTLAAYDSFVATREVPETLHKKVIRSGRTLVAQLLAGSAAKDDPGFTDRLIAHYADRHPVVAAADPAPAATPAPAPAEVAGTAPVAAPAADPAAPPAK